MALWNSLRGSPEVAPGRPCKAEAWAGQVDSRHDFMPQPNEQSLSLSQLSLYDNSSDQVDAASAEMMRLERAVKASETLAKHADQRIIKALNTGQTDHVFSYSSKTGGFTAAKVSDFAIDISDDNLKTFQVMPQLVALVNLVKGLLT
eukprot:COSAG05_NODE_244_length_12990_cov_6.892018_2_plen_147_part_00